ncbi:uncharacterized protein LOC129393680 [Pan paniscus]|uniref:uncharacterized protein LOC129393680 n=1 Tax=Pan paniscus TaxID=9597 RepID=UPI0030041761
MQPPEQAFTAPISPLQWAGIDAPPSQFMLPSPAPACPQGSFSSACGVWFEAIQWLHTVFHMCQTLCTAGPSKIQPLPTSLTSLPWAPGCLPSPPGTLLSAMGARVLALPAWGPHSLPFILSSICSADHAQEAPGDFPAVPHCAHPENAPPAVQSERAGAECALRSSLSQQLPLQHLENRFLKCWFSGKQEQPSTPGPLPALEPVGPVEGMAALIKSKFQNVCALSWSLHRGKREQELRRVRKKTRPFWKESHTHNHGMELKGGVKTGAGLRSPGCWCGISLETADMPNKKEVKLEFSKRTAKPGP